MLQDLLPWEVYTGRIGRKRFRLLPVERTRLEVKGERHLLGWQPALRGPVRRRRWRVQTRQQHAAARLAPSLTAAALAAAALALAAAVALATAAIAAAASVAAAIVAAAATALAIPTTCVAAVATAIVAAEKLSHPPVRSLLTRRPHRLARKLRCRRLGHRVQVDEARMAE